MTDHLCRPCQDREVEFKTCQSPGMCRLLSKPDPEHLCTAFSDWCDAQKLPHGGVEDLLAMRTLSARQREWLLLFRAIWRTNQTAAA